MGRYTAEDVEIGVGAGIVATSGAATTGLIASAATAATHSTLVSLGLSIGSALTPVAPFAIAGGLVLLAHGVYRKAYPK